MNSRINQIKTSIFSVVYLALGSIKQMYINNFQIWCSVMHTIRTELAVF